MTASRILQRLRGRAAVGFICLFHRFANITRLWLSVKFDELNVTVLSVHRRLHRSGLFNSGWLASRCQGVN